MVPAGKRMCRAPESRELRIARSSGGVLMIPLQPDNNSAAAARIPRTLSDWLLQRAVGESALLQIALVVFFRTVESGGRSNFGDDRPGEAALLLGLGGLRSGLLLGGMEEHGRTVLRAYVRTLAIQRGRVVILPKHIEQLAVGYARGIKFDLDHFGVTGSIGADVAIGGVRKRAAHVADRGIDNSGNTPESSFDPPEAACTERSFF